MDVLLFYVIYTLPRYFITDNILFVNQPSFLFQVVVNEIRVRWGQYVSSICLKI